MSRRIRVLHIIKSLGRGGAEMLLPETLKLHDKEKFEFHYIYFLPWKDQMVGALIDNGGIVQCFDASNNLSIMLKAKAVSSYINSHCIDIVHAHLPWAGIVARLVGRLSGVPVLYTEHNKQERYHFGTRFMNLATMNMLREVIAVSHEVAVSISKHKPKLQTPVRVISNGVNTDHFSKKLVDGSIVRKILNIPSDAPVIGTVSVFRSQKRLDLWLEIAAKILQAKNKAHFVIVGDGPLREQIIRKCDQLNVNDRVHLTGLITEVRPYLAAFDVYMMCSKFEGMPVAMLEAMSMECAVISTDAGGIKEVIDHNANGMLCSVNDWETLSSFAVQLLDNKVLRSQFGEQGRKKVIANFSIGTLVGSLESLYLQIDS